MKKLILLLVACLSIIIVRSGNIYSKKIGLEVERNGTDLWFITNLKIDSLTCDSIQKGCFINRQFVCKVETIFAPDSAVADSIYLRAYKTPNQSVRFNRSTQWTNKGFPWVRSQVVSYAHTVIYDSKYRIMKVNKSSLIPKYEYDVPALSTIFQLLIIVLLTITLAARIKDQHLIVIYFVLLAVNFFQAISFISRSQRILAIISGIIAFIFCLIFIIWDIIMVRKVKMGQFDSHRLKEIDIFVMISICIVSILGTTYYASGLSALIVLPLFIFILFWIIRLLVKRFGCLPATIK